MPFEVWKGIWIPFAGTLFGSACVFFMRKAFSTFIQRGLTGFASGVMVAASIWSLLVPAMEQADAMGRWAFLPAIVGFWIGVLFLLFLDRLIPHLHRGSSQAEGLKSSLKRSTMLVLAVALHNLPEGMAVGAVYAGWLSGDGQYAACRCAGPVTGYCCPEFSGGRYHFYATEGRRDIPKKGVFLRYAFRYHRTYRRTADLGRGGNRSSGTSLFFELCGRCDDLCCRGGVDS